MVEGKEIKIIVNYSSSESEPEPKVELKTPKSLKNTKNGKLDAQSDNNGAAIKSINPAPFVESKPLLSSHLSKVSTRELTLNQPLADLSKPIQGPANPFSRSSQIQSRNTMSGYTEDHFMNDDAFKSAKRTFDSYGYTLDPNAVSSKEMVGDLAVAALKKNGMIGDVKKIKLERHDKGNVADSTFRGPWAGYKKDDFDAEKVLDPAVTDYVEQPVFDSSKLVQDRIIETSTFHGLERRDYLGRSFLHPTNDYKSAIKENFIPKTLVHTWTGHTKGVNVIKFFPTSAHLIISGSMDTKIKIWDVYNDRAVKRTYMGHTKGVKDICFTSDGSKFLSCSYDRSMKLWDTETGECISRFTNKRIPFCVQFNPDPEKEHQFLMGCQDKKIYQYDVRSGDIVQTYDQHMGAVNTITFLDEGERFVSTSDDKTLRAWKWDIPVVIKYVSEPDMHSLPAASLSTDKKWLACQSLDNKIVIYSVGDRIKLNRKKLFNGHLVAGFTCKPNFSTDGRFVMSGDSEGKMWFWDWKTCKVFKKFAAHDGPISSCLWHPHETSKVATCSNDGTIKYWD